VFLLKIKKANNITKKGSFFLKELLPKKTVNYSKNNGISRKFAYKECLEAKRNYLCYQFLQKVKTQH
jgi:hypothetical protein